MQPLRPSRLVPTRTTGTGGQNNHYAHGPPSQASLLQVGAGGRRPRPARPRLQWTTCEDAWRFHGMRSGAQRAAMKVVESSKKIFTSSPACAEGYDTPAQQREDSTTFILCRLRERRKGGRFCMEGLRRPQTALSPAVRAKFFWLGPRRLCL